MCVVYPVYISVCVFCVQYISVCVVYPVYICVCVLYVQYISVCVCWWGDAYVHRPKWEGWRKMVGVFFNCLFTLRQALSEPGVLCFGYPSQ